MTVANCHGENAILKNKNNLKETKIKKQYTAKIKIKMIWLKSCTGLYVQNTLNDNDKNSINNLPCRIM